MKVGDKVICRKDTKDKLLKIDFNIGDIYTVTFIGNAIIGLDVPTILNYCVGKEFFYEYFELLKELRKRKIKKINESR